MGKALKRWFGVDVAERVRQEQRRYADHAARLDRLTSGYAERVRKLHAQKLNGGQAPARRREAWPARSPCGAPGI